MENVIKDIPKQEYVEQFATKAEIADLKEKIAELPTKAEFNKLKTKLEKNMTEVVRYFSDTQKVKFPNLD